jgi:hypothetical protein
LERLDDDDDDDADINRAWERVKSFRRREYWLS